MPFFFRAAKSQAFHELALHTSCPCCFGWYQVQVLTALPELANKKQLLQPKPRSGSQRRPGNRNQKTCIQNQAMKAVVHKFVGAGEVVAWFSRAYHWILCTSSRDVSQRTVEGCLRCSEAAPCKSKFGYLRASPQADPISVAGRRARFP